MFEQYKPTEEENNQAFERMSSQEKTLTKMREDMLKSLEEMGKRGFVTKKTDQLTKEEIESLELNRSYFKEGSPRLTIEGVINEHRFKYQIVNAKDIQGNNVKFEKLWLDNEEVPIQESIYNEQETESLGNEIREKYKNIAYNLDKEEALLSSLQEDREKEKQKKHNEWLLKQSRETLL